MPVEDTPDIIPEVNPMNIATISAGFEKGDFLVREEQGNRVYFDFFEEVRIGKSEEKLSALLFFDFRQCLGFGNLEDQVDV